MSKFEQLLDYLVNEEMDKANELFHEIVVEKSRDIYENLIAEEEVDEAEDEEVDEAEEDDEELDEAAEDDEEVDEAYDEETDEGVLGTMAGAGLGAALGGPLGAAAGGVAGDKIGDWWSDKKEESADGPYDNSPDQANNPPSSKHDAMINKGKHNQDPAGHPGVGDRMDGDKPKAFPTFEAQLMWEYKQFVKE